VKSQRGTLPASASAAAPQIILDVANLPADLLRPSSHFAATEASAGETLVQEIGGALHPRETSADPTIVAAAARADVFPGAAHLAVQLLELSGSATIADAGHKAARHLHADDRAIRVALGGGVARETGKPERDDG